MPHAARPAAHRTPARGRPSTARRALLPTAVVLLTGLLGAPVAQAANVTGPGPWKASNRYLVKADVDGRTAPKLEPRAKVDYLKAGQRVRISCQTTGQSAYGSRLWVKVGRYYVPDQLIKTYTDGRLKGAPRCSGGSSSSPSGPKPGTTLPSPQGGYGSYSQTYTYPRALYGWTTADIADTVRRDFSRYFPIKGCGGRITLGERCDLSVPGPDQPVRVIAVADDGFALKSLPGHLEGAGRTITFRYQPIDLQTDDGNLRRQQLVVSAWGPTKGLSLLGPINSNTLAKHYWTRFADNLGSKLPECPRGKDYVKGYGCGVTA